MAYLGCYMRYKPSKSEWPWYRSLEVTNVKCKHTIGLPIYAFLLMFNSTSFTKYKSSKVEWPWLVVAFVVAVYFPNCTCTCNMVYWQTV